MLKGEAMAIVAAEVLLLATIQAIIKEVREVPIKEDTIRIRALMIIIGIGNSK